MKKIVWFIVILALCFVFTSCAKNEEPKGKEVFSSLPDSLDSLAIAYQENKEIFLNTYIEEGDITSMFLFSQFFDHVEIKEVFAEGDNFYKVFDHKDEIYSIHLEIEDDVIVDFTVKEGE